MRDFLSQNSTSFVNWDTSILSWLNCLTQSIAEFLFEWQTIVPGFLAVVAAAGTVFYMWLAAEKQRQRRSIACRAMLPADLSSICGYAKDSVHASCIALSMLRRGQTRDRVKIPELPERVLENLQALVEHLDHQDVDAVCELLRCYQIQHARLSGEIADFNNPNRPGATKLVTESNLESTITKTVELHLIATKMFPFARNATKHIPELDFSRQELRNTIAVLEFDHMVSDELIASLDHLVNKHN